MNQLELWDKKEGARKPLQNFRRARKTQRSRVANLHRWRNIYTGETCQQTTQEFSKSKRIPKSTCQSISKSSRVSREGWRHEAYLGKVIQGDPIDWLTGGTVKNGSKSIQTKTGISKAWDEIVVIMARYHRGEGVKAIGNALGYSPASVLYALKDAGIDTTKRRNYIKPIDLQNRIEKRKGRYREAMKTTSIRIKKRVMSRIWKAMNGQSVSGRGCFSMVGCSVSFLRRYIETKFTSGMTWDNYGEWHIDHIKPCASFDLGKKDQLLDCFNWRNLQPMWAFDNISKGSKYAKA
jgi:hypothetical protein